jgi:alpha-beta hydrolase superfamily lysophospholipase
MPPEDVRAWAVAVFLHGSGPQDRDENSPGLALHVFDTLAADLAAVGVASLRYDKRGVGQSTGELLNASVHDLAADARAAVRFARRVYETAGLPVYLVGHSEGSILALLLAGDEPPPAGMILLSPSVTPMEDVLRRQAAGVQATIERLPAAERQRLGIPDGFDQRQVTEQMIAMIKAAPPEQATLPMGNQVLPVRWFRSHFELDLRAAAGRVRCPVLAISGAKDAQVPPRDAEVLVDIVRRAAAERGESADATAHVLPDLTHILRRSTGSGGPGEYPQLAQQPVDPELRQRIREWLLRHRPAEVQPPGPGS